MYLYSMSQCCEYRKQFGLVVCECTWVWSNKLARVCDVLAVGVRAVNRWQWRSGHYNHQSFLFSPPFFSPSPFFSVMTFSHRRSARIKKLIWRKLLRTPKNLGVHPFPDPVNHFEFCRRCSVTGCERVPPSPLGWYLIHLSLDQPNYA